MKSQHVAVRIRVVKAEEGEINKIILQVMEHSRAVFEGYVLVNASNIHIVLCSLIGASGAYTWNSRISHVHLY